MRTPIIAGNWKMNKTPAGARQFAQAFLPLLKSPGCTVVLCPPAVSIAALSDALAGAPVALGAQNLYPADAGAFTGEISAPMLTELGCRYVILGHSERRAMGETDAFIREKVLSALSHGLRPIVCVGERLAQRELGDTDEVITAQVQAALDGLTAEQAAACIFAYEPLWAIGTGVTATPEQAQAVCSLIRAVIAARFSKETAERVPILYGGSMNETNAAALLACRDVDGGLIGGASLIPEKFISIIQAANAAGEGSL